MEAPPGIEPGIQPYKGCVIPFNYRAIATSIYVMILPYLQPKVNNVSCSSFVAGLELEPSVIHFFPNNGFLEPADLPTAANFCFAIASGECFCPSQCPPGLFW